MNVADLLTRQAKARPQASAVIHEDLVFSYAAWERLVWGLCRHLREQGLQTGDSVGLCLTDPLLHLAAILAAARSGLVSVAVTAEGGQTEAGQRILARTGARALIDDQPGLDWPQLTRLPLQRALLLALDGQADPMLRGEPPHGLVHVKASSGTTGEPKLVGATHAGLVATIEREIGCIGYPVGERYLTPVALRYDAPRRRYLSCLAAGGTAVLPPRDGSLAALVDTIDRHDVRHFSSVASQAWELAQLMAPGRQRFASMRCLRLSAGPSDASLHRLLRERLTSNVVVSYGCTELGPMTVAPPELVLRHPQSVGRPMPGVEVQVVSDRGEPLPTGAVGQLRIRAEGMPQAYHDDPVATAKGFREGWFHPGDLGRIDADGLLFHMGRADSMMIMNGINIYPAEIEQAMQAHPAVRDAVAMPVKHRVAHEVPVCAVALNEGAQATELDLLRFARRQLGSHSPRRVVVLGEIPRNEHGKVRRAALQQALAAPRAVARKPPAPAAAGRVLGQLSLPARLSFRLPAPLDLARLDAWLFGALGLDRPPDTGRSTPADAWLERALGLTRLLLQALRVPVFDPPRILACRPGPDGNDHWRAEVAFARIDEIPVTTYQVAFNGALQLNTWALARPVDDDRLQAFFALAESLVLARLRPTLPFGKSSLPVLRVAHAKSIPFMHLGHGVFQLGWGARAQRMDRSATGRDPIVGARLCADKAATAALLRKAGLPAPVHKVVTTPAAAQRAARSLGWPVVVKPADGERGEGVTVDVDGDTPLQAAFEAAQAASRSRSVIVERQVDGVCHRLFITRGRLLYAVRREPMRVDGDGVSSVARLVDAEVARQRRLPPWERSGIEPLDDLARAVLARAGFTPASVPARGERVPLRRIESTAWGGIDDEVTSQIHPENLRVALAAADLFGLDMAGIDLLTADITRPWFDNGAIVNEVNFAPLLGGAPISRSHIPAFLDGFVEGNGRIPIDVFVGGDAAWSAAAQHAQAQRAQGRHAWLTGARQTLAPDGSPWPMPLDGLHRRTRALLLLPRVQALVLVVQTDEFLDTGLPMEAVSRLHIVDRRLASRSAADEPLAPARAQALLALLATWPWSSAPTDHLDGADRDDAR